MDRKFLFIMENNKIYIFFLLSLILHLLILLFFIDNKTVKKIFYIKLNNNVSAIGVEDFSIIEAGEGADIGLKKNAHRQKSVGAITKDIRGINNPAPEYPEIALRWGYEGIVKLKISINTTGKVYNVEIMKSSGYKILDDEAVKTAYMWQFEKPSREVTVEKVIEFKIKETP